MPNSQLIASATDRAKRCPYWGGTPNAESSLTIDRIKRMAKRWRKDERDLSHTQALDRVAMYLGFHSFSHARTVLMQTQTESVLADYLTGLEEFR